MKRSHRDLRAWQKAIDLVSAVYKFTQDFPEYERYGLVGQMRRAAVSVPANIAEGAARNSTKELLHFLSISCGSLSELDTLVSVSEKLGYVKNGKSLQNQIDDVSGLVMGLAASLRRRS